MSLVWTQVSGDETPHPSSPLRKKRHHNCFPNIWGAAGKKYPGAGAGLEYGPLESSLFVKDDSSLKSAFLSSDFRRLGGGGILSLVYWCCRADGKGWGWRHPSCVFSCPSLDLRGQLPETKGLGNPSTPTPAPPAPWWGTLGLSVLLAEGSGPLGPPTLSLIHPSFPSSSPARPLSPGSTAAQWFGSSQIP